MVRHDIGMLLRHLRPVMLRMSHGLQRKYNEIQHNESSHSLQRKDNEIQDLVSGVEYVV